MDFQPMKSFAFSTLKVLSSKNKISRLSKTSS